MKCRKCNIEEVDGRKQTVCQKCIDKEDLERKQKDEERMTERLKTEELVKKVITEKDIKTEIWNNIHANNNQLIVKAICYELLERNATNWDIDRNNIDTIRSIMQVLKQTKNGHEYDCFYDLKEMVNHIVDKMYKGVI